MLVPQKTVHIWLVPGNFLSALSNGCLRMLTTRSPAMRQMSIPMPSAARLLIRTQRRSSRWSRNDLTGPPSISNSSSVRGSSGSVAMNQWEGKMRSGFVGRIGLGAFGGFDGRRRINLMLARVGITVVVHRAVDLVGNLVGRLLEFLDSLAESLGQFRQLLGPEQNQDDRENQDDFPSAKKSSKQSIHKRVFLMVTLGRASGRVKHHSSGLAAGPIAGWFRRGPPEVNSIREAR